MEYSNDKFDEILKYVLKGENILLHGPGGVGKSYLLGKLSDELYNRGFTVYLTATTGVAAINLSNNTSKHTASTLHSFAGIGLGQMDSRELISKIENLKYVKKRWQNTEILIIDEISMLGADLFDKLSDIACVIRRKTDKEFGRIQLILGGDFLQLPPVKDEWVFMSKKWNNLNLYPFYLSVPHRFVNDVDFFNLLMRVRKGEINEDINRRLRSRVKAHKKMNDIINKLKEDPREVIKPTLFFSRKADVEKYNISEIEKLNTEMFTFIAKDTFKVKNKGRQQKILPKYKDYIKILEDDLPEYVYLKEGAQVMLKVNLDVKKGYVNGSRAVISRIIPNEAVIAKFLDGNKMRVDITPREYEDKFAIATRNQIPFVLAYACTIHKSQGSTLDYCICNLGSSIFCEGQAYVALSRCKNMKGLFLSEFNSSSIMVNETALNYTKELENIENNRNI